MPKNLKKLEFDLSRNIVFVNNYKYLEDLMKYLHNLFHLELDLSGNCYGKNTTDIFLLGDSIKYLPSTL